MRVSLLVLTAGGVVSAAGRWQRVATPHFEMYTTSGEKSASRALQTFEQVRYFFLQNSKGKQAPEEQVRIIAFSSEKEYRPYRMNSGAFAYYLQSREHDYIVMQDIEPEHHRAAVHEYTHLIVQHTKMTLPIWLNEGLAELYSSLEPRGDKQAMVGRAIETSVMTLRQRPWMDWNALFAVDHSSPFYNEREKMSIFYAQSWALTHMLALSSGYSPKFGSFLSTMAEGATAPQALEKIYGKTVPEIAKDASAYIQQFTMHAAVFNVSLSSSELNPQVSDLSAFQTDLALAELLATRKETASEAQERLVALSQQDKENVEVEEALGYLAWQMSKQNEATKHFVSAAERGSKNVRMLYDLAVLQQMEEGGLPAATATLHKAIALQPDNNEARILLAEVETRQSHYGLALSAIGNVKTVKPDQAYRFFAISAFIHANMRDLNGARQAATKATEYAKTPKDRDQITRLLQSIGNAERPAAVPKGEASGDDRAASTSSTQDAGPPPSPKASGRLLRDEGLPEVHGTIKTLECVKPGYRLHIVADGHEMVFEMGDPQDILVRNEKNLVWNCGPLPAREITVIYGKSSIPKLEGKVAELVFNSEAKR